MKDVHVNSEPKRNVMRNGRVMPVEKLTDQEKKDILAHQQVFMACGEYEDAVI